MVWFRTDDSFYDHPKVVSIPRAVRPEAIGTWLLAGSWCGKHLTDGVLPISQVEELGGTMAGALALVKARLWTKTKTEFRFRHWEEYQPTRAQVEAARESERTRKARQRAKPTGQTQDSAPRPDGSPAHVPPGHPPDNTGTAAGTPPGVPDPSHQVSGTPDPTRPDPLPRHDQSSYVPDREAPRDDDEGSAARSGYWAGWKIQNPQRLIALIGQAVDRPVTERQAVQIVAGLLAKASPKQPVRNVQAYVEGALRDSWAEIQRDLDTAAVAA